MTREEIIERFTLEAVSASPGTFDYAKLDWMNGVYLRALAPDSYADEVVAYLRERGVDWPEDRIRAMAPLVQEKVGRLGEIPDFTRFLFEDVAPDPGLLDRRILAGAEQALAAVDDWTAPELEAALKRLCDDLGEKPRTVFAPIRVAVTGSRVSPGLYESLELLGRETSLARLRRGQEIAA
jgi:glutamyl-tRNA synthetase